MLDKDRWLDTFPQPTLPRLVNILVLSFGRGDGESSITLADLDRFCLLCVRSCVNRHSLGLCVCACYLGKQAAFDKCRKRARHFEGVYTLPYKSTCHRNTLLGSCSPSA